MLKRAIRVLLDILGSAALVFRATQATQAQVFRVILAIRDLVE